MRQIKIQYINDYNCLDYLYYRDKISSIKLKNNQEVTEILKTHAVTDETSNLLIQTYMYSLSMLIKFEILTTLLIHFVVCTDICF